MHLPPFPPEIWSQAVSWLPISQQKSLLEVSRFFHDIALPFVFSSVKIYILGGYETLEMLETNDRAFALETEHKLMRRSWEILHRILEDPQFARLVKDLTVVAFTESQAVFEILTLTKTLGTLKNLCTFRCYGTDSSDDILMEIIQAVPSTTQHVLYSTRLSFDVLNKLPNLTYLEYRNIVYYPEHDYVTFLPLSGNTLSGLGFIPSLHTRLQALSIDAGWVDRIPVWVYNQLTSLEINSENHSDPINIDFICHHCPILESLSLVGEVHVAVCLTLPQEPTFPKLRSFRLSCKWYTPAQSCTTEHILAVSRFIQSHNNLRRLYLRILEGDWLDVDPFLTSIKGLRHLEVLGFNTGTEDLDEEMLATILAHLPFGLRALQLAMSWDTNTGSHAAILMDALSVMPNLTFLHVYRTYMRLPLSAEELAIELKSLTMVGLTRALWDIDRTGPEIQVSKWPRWKVRFFAESDFQDPDAAWLFKYR